MNIPIFGGFLCYLFALSNTSFGMLTKASTAQKQYTAHMYETDDTFEIIQLHINHPITNECIREITGRYYPCSECGCIEELYVEPEHRKNKHGSTLLQKIIECFRKKACSTIHLFASPETDSDLIPLILFYNRHNFTIDNDFLEKHTLCKQAISGYTTEELIPMTLHLQTD